MAALMEATERYLSRDNRAMGAVASVVASTMALPTPGSMTRAGGSTSPISQVISTFRNMIGALRGINNEKDKQREITDRVRRATDENRREQGAPIRNMPEQPEETNQRPNSIFETILSILRQIFSSIRTIMTLIMRTITQLTRVVLRTGMTIVTGALRAVLAGISSIMRNPRLRLLAAGATAAAALAAYIFGRGDEQEPTTPGQPPSATPSTPGSLQRVPTDSAPIPSNSGLPIDYTTYAQQIGQRESGGNYQAVNRIGYLGKYQFGAPALQDMGLVRSGTTMRGLDDPSNWTIEGGKQAFLNNPQLQEDTMVRYTNQNFRALNRLGVINNQSSNEQIAGYLAAAHLLGPGGARNLAQGRDGADAFGTSGSSYYRLGAATQTARAVPTQASVTSSGDTQIATTSNAPQQRQAPPPAPAPTPSSPEPVAPAPSQAPQTVASLPTSGMGATEKITEVQPIVIRERAA